MKRIKLILPFVYMLSLVFSSCNFLDNFLSENENGKKDEQKEEGFFSSVEVNKIDVKSIFNEDATITNRGEESGTLKELFLDRSTKASTPNYSNSVTYSNKIAEPSNKVSNAEQFGDVLDYHAFYYDSEPFKVKLNSDYPSADKRVINDAFYKSKLCPGVVGLNYAYDVNYREYSIQMLFNENANMYTASPFMQVSKVTIPYNYVAESRADYYNDFPYLKNPKGEVDVYNSDQVLYALEKNYIPVPFHDSPAEVILNRSKDILRKIIKQNMTELDKITAIYMYILANNTYDDAGEINAAYIIDEEKYPDFVASHFRSFFAEGSLVDGQSVCHGFSKGFNILANMEGITSTKISSRFKDSNMNSFASNIYSKEDPEIPGEYSNHGYSYVLNKSDNKYYIVDPTYAFSGSQGVDNKLLSAYRRPAIMKSFKDWSKIYNNVADTYHDSIGMGSKSIDFSNNIKFGNNLTSTIDTLSELKTYLNNLVSFMSSYSDLSYKTSTTHYCVNLSIKELDNNPDLLEEASSDITNIINTAQEDIYKFKKYILNHYFSSDFGLLIYLSF